MTGGNENFDWAVFSSFPVRAIVAREFLSRQVERWRGSWHDGVMEPDGASSDWCPRTTVGSEFGSSALLMCTSNVQFFGCGLKHLSETQSQRRYRKDAYKSLAPPSRVGSDATDGEEERVVTAKEGECRSDAVTRLRLGVKTRATLMQRAVRIQPTQKRLTVVNLAVLSLLP